MVAVRSLFLSFSIVFLLCAHQLTGQSVFREFSNAAGQTIKARPVNIIGEEVRIQFEDNRVMNVTLDAFVEEDAAYLRDWAIVELAHRDRLLDVVVTRREYKVDRTSGGDSESNVKLIGIWAKIYYKGEQVDEYALPDRLPSSENW